MKKLLIISLLLLSGCAAPKTTTVSMKWPNVPQELTTPAADLIPLQDKDHSFTSLLLNADRNYSQYYQLRKKYEAWQEWYKTQQRIYQQSK